MNHAQHAATAEERNAQRIADTMLEAIRRTQAGEPPSAGAGAKILARRRATDPSQIANGAVVEIDAKRIGPGPFANRHPFNWKAKDFDQLKRLIESQGGNVQPIKVRPAPSGSDFDFEVVYGLRRYRACLALGLPVRAVVEQLGDLDAIAQLLGSNEGWVNCTPYEKGKLCIRAVEAGLYETPSALANALGLDDSAVHKQVKLAKLPPDVVDAFGSPARLQVNWGASLHKALSEDGTRVLRCAKRIVESGEPTDPKLVFRELCGVRPAPDATPSGRQIPVRRREQAWAEIHVPASALGEGIRVQFEPGVVDAKALEEALRALAARA